MSEQKKIILVIDDSLATLTAIQSILEGSYELSLAKNTDIALTILGTLKVDLILLDMEMPGISGMEFLEMMHENPDYYHIPVIVVSSYGTPEVISNAKKYGAVDFVVKPVSPEKLLGKTNSIIRNARTKISKVGLYRKLQILESASVKGQKNQVELAIADLELNYYDLKIDSQITEICRHARKMEYDVTVRNIKPLLSQLSDPKPNIVYRKL